MIHTKGKTFTIERSKWLRGEGNWNSSLHRSRDRKMCCLGQVMAACGVPIHELDDVGDPTDVDSEIEVEGLCEWDPDEEEPCRKGLNEHISEMMSVNDAHGMPDTERESRLAELAELAGFSLKFVD